MSQSTTTQSPSHESPSTEAISAESPSTEAASAESVPQTPPPPPTPVESFDALYAEAAPALVHQTFLLTGRRRHAFDSVEHAFQRAWEHWPEVSHDPDPVAWVRARAYDYALAPWHRYRLRPHRPAPPPADPAHRALLELPPPYRRTVLLCDGLGLSVEEAAEECAASVPATVSRLRHARADLARGFAEPVDPDDLRASLSELVAAVSTATLPLARSVRTGSERRVRALTRTVYGLTAVLLGAVVFSAVGAPPPDPGPAPHGRVTDDGVPPRDATAPARP